MSKVQISRGKFEHINATADARGVIAAAAMDQRGSLQKAIGKERGGQATVEDMKQFKEAVVRILTPHASAVLIDPEYGLEALRSLAPGTGVLLAYERSGYDATDQNRMPDLLPEWSARRLLNAGADAVKILLYLNPFDSEKINAVKLAFIERVGAECAANDMAFFLEPIVYDNAMGDAKSLEFAKAKPRYVTAAMAELSKPQYRVDILKVEVPVNMNFVEGTRAFKGEKAYSRQDAIKLFREAAAASAKPFIYLSAGVSDEVFRETLELAGEADTPFSGVLCGRATWQDGIPVFAKSGYDALIDWMGTRGVENIEALNRLLVHAAKPWWTLYGGIENIEVVG